MQNTENLSIEHGLKTEDVISGIEKAISMGIHNFLNGGMGHFDQISAVAVNSLKSKYPNIEQIWIKPYPTQKISCADLFDDSGLYALEWHIEHIGSRRAIPERNEYMIQQSSVAICHIEHKSSGAFKTYMKANESGLHIIEV